MPPYRIFPSIKKIIKTKNHEDHLTSYFSSLVNKNEAKVALNFMFSVNSFDFLKNNYFPNNREGATFTSFEGKIFLIGGRGNSLRGEACYLDVGKFLSLFFLLSFIHKEHLIYKF